MSSIPPITCLRSFEAVARLGSVTAAAKELHVTHSAISQQIKVLEEMIGVTLFVREGRGLRVSEDGRLYALQIRESLSGIAEATRLIKTQPKSTELVVAVLPSFGFSWLLPRLPRFQQSQPHISIRLQASLALSNLTRESVDVGIRMGKGDWDGLEQHLLFHDETLVVAAPHFNGGVLPQTPEEIISSTIIFNMESWQPWCQAAGLALASACAATTPTWCCKPCAWARASPWNAAAWWTMRSSVENWCSCPRSPPPTLIPTGWCCPTGNARRSSNGCFPAGWPTKSTNT